LTKYIKILTIYIKALPVCRERIVPTAAAARRISPQNRMMDTDLFRKKLEGCYVTLPTPFNDDADFTVNRAALKTHINFLLDGGLTADNATFLAGGAAGDFSTMTFDERLLVAEAVAEAVGGRVPIAFGAQTTSTLELARLAGAAQRMGFDFIQVSCPFYFTHTEADFEEFVKAAADAAPEVGIIIYNTFWTASGVSFSMIERLSQLENVVGLKWAAPRTDAMEFEDVCSHFSGRFTVIDNNLLFAFSAMPSLGARAFESHLCNFWPAWGVRLVERVRAGNYTDIARMMTAQAMPWYKLWVEIENQYTSGDGYLDKLCMELVGLPSSRCRPPTRDIRRAYREKTRAMLRAIGVPNLVEA